MARIYLDHNATTPLSEPVKAAIAQALEVYGNPSSVHQDGRAARKIVEDAREAVAHCVGSRPADVVFTGSATEANTMIVRAFADAGHSVFVSSIEHASVIDVLDASNVTIIPVSQEGIVEATALEALLSERFAPVDDTGGAEPFLVSVMLANNETGAIQPIHEIARVVHAYGGLIHCDAVQAIGKLPVNMSDLGIDFLSLSAHKFGGPKGVGALIATAASLKWLKPLFLGGGQERRYRAGTENLLGIAGLGEAARHATQRMKDMQRLGHLRDGLDDAVIAIDPQTVIFAKDQARLANTTCFSVTGLSSEKAVIQCDLKSVSIGSGSACSSGKVAPSHVLKAMGASDDLTASSVRVSLGVENTEAEISEFIEVWRSIVTAFHDRRKRAA